MRRRGASPWVILGKEAHRKEEEEAAFVEAFWGRDLFGRGEICEARAVGRNLGLCLFGIPEQYALGNEIRCHGESPLPDHREIR